MFWLTRGCPPKTTVPAPTTLTVSVSSTVTEALPPPTSRTSALLAVMPRPPKVPAPLTTTESDSAMPVSSKSAEPLDETRSVRATTSPEMVPAPLTSRASVSAVSLVALAEHDPERTIRLSVFAPSVNFTFFDVPHDMNARHASKRMMSTPPMTSVMMSLRMSGESLSMPSDSTSPMAISRWPTPLSSTSSNPTTPRVSKAMSSSRALYRARADVRTQRGSS